MLNLFLYYLIIFYLNISAVVFLGLGWTGLEFLHTLQTNNMTVVFGLLI